MSEQGINTTGGNPVKKKRAWVEEPDEEEIKKQTKKLNYVIGLRNKKATDTKVGSWILIVIKMTIISLLVVAVFFNEEPDYYIFLRWYVSMGCLMLLIIYYTLNRSGVSLILSGFIMLFNPVFIIELQRDNWCFIDAALSVYLAVICHEEYVSMKKKIKEIQSLNKADEGEIRKLERMM